MYGNGLLVSKILYEYIYYYFTDYSLDICINLVVGMNTVTFFLESVDKPLEFLCKFDVCV